MGNFLDKPETTKHSEKGFGSDVSYGCSSMQGWRDKMEDSVCINVSFPHGSENWSFFAVFDGHGGHAVSLYCAEHLLNTIVHTEEFQHSLKQAEDEEVIKAGLEMGFFKVEEQMRNIPDIYEGKAGTTVVCILISTLNFYFANCGDSRAALWRDATAFFSTEDHKPSNPREERRIQEAGGVVRNQRVNGSLAVSRALGDFRFKQIPDKHPYEQIVSPEPEVTVISRNNELDEFLVIACDGIWDVMEVDNLCHYIHDMLLITTDLECICDSVIDACLYKGSKDNMSIIIVVLPGAPHISESAVLRDQEVNRILEERLTEIMSNENNDSITMQDIIDTISSVESSIIPSREDLWFKSAYLQAIKDRLKKNFVQPEE